MQAITALKHQANTSHYKLLIRTVPDNSFSVTAFTGSHYGISRDYSFSVDVTANSILNTGTVIGNCATLEIYWGGTVINVNGLVTRFFPYRSDPRRYGLPHGYQFTSCPIEEQQKKPCLCQ